MNTLDALKSLAVALGCAKSTDKVSGDSVAEVIDFIAKHLPKTSSK